MPSATDDTPAARARLLRQGLAELERLDAFSNAGTLIASLEWSGHGNDDGNDREEEEQGESKDNSSAHNGSTGEHASSRPAPVSIAYERQPLRHEVAHLVRLGIQSLSDLFKSDASPGADGGNNNHNSENNNASRCAAAVALFFPLLLLALFLLDDFGRSVKQNMRLRNISRSGLPRSPAAEATVEKMMHPVLRRKTIHEFPGIKRELMWVPLELTLDADAADTVAADLRCPRAILFLFHGCNRYAASFFYSPQGRRLVSLASKLGIDVVAFEKEHEQACWGWDADGEVIRKIGRKFLHSRTDCGMDSNGKDIVPPIWAFGASSGGTFIAMLASKMKEDPDSYAPFLFSAINIQIMDPPEHLDWDIPTIFTIMDEDLHTKQRVHERVAKKQQGGPFEVIRTSGRKGVHPDHFAELFPDDVQMTPALSDLIYWDLIEKGIIDRADGDKPRVDPRMAAKAVAAIAKKYSVVSRKGRMQSGAREGVVPFGTSTRMLRPLRPAEVEDADSIWLIEELNVAWDQHEITAEGFEDVLAFFFRHSAQD